MGSYEGAGLSTAVAVVVDPGHDRYGEALPVLSHDWCGAGIIHAASGNGTVELYDGLFDPKDPETASRLPEAAIVDDPDAAAKLLYGLADGIVRLMLAGDYSGPDPDAYRRVWHIIELLERGELIRS